MRPIVAVDLAAKFSAGMLLDPVGNIVRQWDSWNMSHGQVAHQIVFDYRLGCQAGIQPIVVIEDLPPHVPGSDVKRQVYQLQGRIIQQFANLPGQWRGYHPLADVYFVPPMYWQRDMGVWRASPDVTMTVAREYGYEPPDLISQRKIERGARGTAVAVKEAEKQQTDYVDAFLIAVWARLSMRDNKHWDMGVVRQYEC